MMIDLNSLHLPALFDELTNDGCLTRLIEAALQDDHGGAGDITTASLGKDEELEAKFVARQQGVLAGISAINQIIHFRGNIRWESQKQDGETFQNSETIGILSGSRMNILGLERVVLNLIGRLSGVATLTRKFVDEIEGTNAVICDTRKTTPGIRNLEKYAVRCGGGTIHRLGLYDAALFKDNHLAGIPQNELANRIEQAIRTVRNSHEVRFVEVEVDSLEQLREVLRVPDDLLSIVLLDNMTTEQLREAVAIRNDLSPNMLLEASGGVKLSTVRSIAEIGVDRISVGALTHSASSLDFGLDVA